MTSSWLGLKWCHADILCNDVCFNSPKFKRMSPSWFLTMITPDKSLIGQNHFKRFLIGWQKHTSELHKTSCHIFQAPVWHQKNLFYSVASVTRSSFFGLPWLSKQQHVSPFLKSFPRESMSSVLWVICIGIRLSTCTFSVGASMLPDSEIANFQTDFILQLKSTGVWTEFAKLSLHCIMLI